MRDRVTDRGLEKETGRAGLTGKREGEREGGREGGRGEREIALILSLIMASISSPAEHRRDSETP